MLRHIMAVNDLKYIFSILYEVLAICLPVFVELNWLVGQ